MPAWEQGIRPEHYTVVPRVLIFLTRGNQVLLLRGAPTKRTWPNRYNGLGGHIEPGEDVLGAAQRELLEEAGVQTNLSLCGVLMVDTGQSPGVVVFVLCGEYSGEPLKASSEGSLEWVEWDAVSALPCVEDVPILLERLRSMQPGDPPFLAKSSYKEGRLVVTFA